jgi:hypothetical protein
MGKGIAGQSSGRYGPAGTPNGLKRSRFSPRSIELQSEAEQSLTVDIRRKLAVGGRCRGGRPQRRAASRSLGGSKDLQKPANVLHRCRALFELFVTAEMIKKVAIPTDMAGLGVSLHPAGRPTALLAHGRPAGLLPCLPISRRPRRLGERPHVIIHPILPARFGGDGAVAVAGAGKKKGQPLTIAGPTRKPARDWVLRGREGSRFWALAATQPQADARRS